MTLVKEQSELAQFSVDVHLQDSPELVNPLFHLLLGVSLSASEGSMGNELSNWAVLQSLLSASDFDVDRDGSLMARPVFSGDSDAVAEFVDGGSSWGLESFRNLAEG